MWWVPSFRDSYTTFCQISTKNNTIRTYIPLVSSFAKYAVVVCVCLVAPVRVPTPERQGLPAHWCDTHYQFHKSTQNYVHY